MKYINVFESEIELNDVSNCLFKPQIALVDGKLFALPYTIPIPKLNQILYSTADGQPIDVSAKIAAITVDNASVNKIVFNKLVDDYGNYMLACENDISLFGQTEDSIKIIGPLFGSVGTEEETLKSDVISITLPKAIAYIGVNALNNCSLLDSLNYVGTGYQWINIPKDPSWNADASLNYINCSDAIMWTSTAPNDEIWYTTIDNSIYNIPKPSGIDASIVSNTYIDGKGIIKFNKNITNIGDSFGSQSVGTYYPALQSVNMPKSVVTLNRSFMDCTNLKNVYINASVSSINGLFLHGAEGVESLIVDPSNSIYDSRNNCNAIINTATNTLIRGCKNTVFQESVTTIGNDAFAGAGLTEIYLPSYITKLAITPFNMCRFVKSIIVDPNNTVYDSRNNCNAIIETSTNKFIQGCQTTVIPDDITSMYERCFCGIDKLEAVNIPDGVTVIPNRAFLGCENLNNVNLGNSITTIEYSAFNSCSSLKRITLPNSLTTIGNYAFSSCTNLETINIPDSVTDIPTQMCCWCYSLKNVSLGNSITNINNYAFYECTSLENINIPNSVTNIGISVFYKCSFTSIDIPASVTTIGQSAFWSSNLSDITLPDSLTNIAEGLFYQCSNLVNVSLGNSITNISERAFQECSLLTSIDIPASVTTIGDYVFCQSGLQSMNIPAAVTTVGTDIFNCDIKYITVDASNAVYDSRNNCNAIIETATNKLIAGSVNTIIPNDVTTIDTEAFWSRTSLTSIDIPASVTEINNIAFENCTSLSSITVRNTTPPTLGTGVFNSISETYTIYVPANSVDAYKAANNWSQYASHIQAITE